MGRRVGIRAIGQRKVSTNTGGGDPKGERNGSRPSELLSPIEARSGTWKITWGGDAEADDLLLQTFCHLFRRQINTLASPRVFLLDNVPVRDLREIQVHASALTIGGESTQARADFDVVWDAGLLSRAALPERVNLIKLLDAHLTVGGTCVVVAQSQRATSNTFGHSISPEEVAAYFFPAYVVARHEEHEFALPAGRPVAFDTLVLTKLAPLTSEMLDPDLYRSLHAVASRRRSRER
jgi:hypothetical protein